MIDVPDSVRPTEEMLTYKPTMGDIAVGPEHNERIRFLYDQPTPVLNADEQDALKALDGIPATQGDKLRFVYAHGWDIVKARQMLERSVSWRAIYPTTLLELHQKIHRILYRSGIYIHGRNNKFQPLLVIQIPKIDLKRNLVQDYTDLLVFLCEYMIENMLVPGVVEKWQVLLDMDYSWLGQITISDFKRVVETLQSNYPERLSAIYIYRPPFNVEKLYNLLVNALPETTLGKIHLERGRYPIQMAKCFAEQQLERRYGGCADRVKAYWPPRVPVGSLAVNIEETVDPLEHLHSENLEKSLTSSFNDSSSQIKNSEPSLFSLTGTLNLNESQSRPPEWTGAMHIRNSSIGSRTEVIVVDDSIEPTSHWCAGCYDHANEENGSFKSFCALF